MLPASPDVVAQIEDAAARDESFDFGIRRGSTTLRFARDRYGCSSHRLGALGLSRGLVDECLDGETVGVRGDTLRVAQRIGSPGRTKKTQEFRLAASELLPRLEHELEAEPGLFRSGWFSGESAR